MSDSQYRARGNWYVLVYIARDDGIVNFDNNALNVRAHALASAVLRARLLRSA